MISNVLKWFCLFNDPPLISTLFGFVVAHSFSLLIASLPKVHFMFVLYLSIHHPSVGAGKES